VVWVLYSSHSSVVESVEKEVEKHMQFPRWMATEIRWNRNPVSLVSPDNADSRHQCHESTLNPNDSKRSLSRLQPAHYDTIG